MSTPPHTDTATTIAEPLPVMAPAPPSHEGTRLVGIKAHLLGRSHGARAGAIVGAATLAMTVTAYLFHTVCIRWLGAEEYGDIAGMLAFVLLISIPFSSVQGLVAREVAHLRSTEPPEVLRAVNRWIVRRALIAAIVVGALALALTLPVQSALRIDSTWLVALGMIAIPLSALGFVFQGVIQGAQRFRPLSVSYALGGLARPLLIVPILLLGLGGAGALGINSLALLVGLGIAFYAMRDLISPRAELAPRHLDWHEVGTFVLGYLAFASLISTDILLASYFLPPEEVGVYAAASLAGKVALLVPAAIGTILLPKASVRAAAGQSSRRVLLLSSGVCLSVTLAFAAVVSLVPAGLVSWGFGPEFVDAAPLLGWFALTMAVLGVVNLYLFVYLAYRSIWFPVVVGAAAIVQIVLVCIWHGDPRSIVLATLASGLLAIAAHECFFPNSLLRSVLQRMRLATGGHPRPSGQR